MVEVSRFGAAQLSWDPAARCATLEFVDAAGRAGRAEAEHLTADLEAWLGAERLPFRLLVDCTEIAHIDAAWRQLWADFFTDHRDHATLAWFNANPEVALIITMFRKGTGVAGEVFASEAEARAYLAALRP
jgi:anti-anti-sigma regulatory factor